MVLPPPAADDAPGPDAPGWLRRLKVALGLSRAGLLVLVDHAHPERLGELVRALWTVDPDLEVHTEPHLLAEAKPGSTLVLVPRAEDADWLNINRPLFASRALRVVLFCTREVSVALSRKAVDFMDWISLRLECPEGPAPFAVAGLRRALAVRAPGIVWTGGDLEASFAAARPLRRLRRVSAARPYEELVAEVRASHGDWLAWTEVDGEFRLRRVRWALAEARRRTRTLLVKPSVRSPGWWEVHGRTAAPGEAREVLRRAGAKFPGRLAALMDLEPEAIQLLGGLLERGVSERALEEELRKEADPGTALGRLATTQGLIAETDAIRGRAPPLVMRAFGAEPRRMRQLHAAELDAIEHRLSKGEQVDAETAAWWSAWARTLPTEEGLQIFGQRGEGAEAILRNAPRTGWVWQQLSSVASAAGDMDAAYVWAQHMMESDPARWEAFTEILEQRGQLSEAELLLRHQLTANANLTDGHRARILHDLGNILFQQGRYTEAEKSILQALTLAEQELGTDHPSHGASLHLLAVVLDRQGRFAEAEQLARQSLSITEKTFGPGHPNYGASLHVLAKVLGSQGRYVEAETLLRNSLSITEKTFGPGHPNYGASLHDLAQSVQRQGRHTEAEKLLRQSLSIIEQWFGQAHPHYGMALHTLAFILESQGRFTEAEQVLRQSFALKEQGLGPEHPEYGASLHALASVLENQGHHTEAEKLLHHALAIFEQSLGQGHPNYAKSLHALANVTQSQGRHTEAEKLLRQSLALEEQGLGPHHPDLIPTLAYLGFNLALQERPQEGEPFLLRSVEIARNTWGPNHPETAQALDLLARVQAAMGKPEAVTTAQQAKDSLLASLGPEHPATKAALPGLDRILSGAK